MAEKIYYGISLIVSDSAQTTLFYLYVSVLFLRLLQSIKY